MMFVRRHIERAVAVVTVTVLASACGGGASEESSTVPGSTVTTVAEAEGSELAGVRFDIRRDPG